MRAVARWWRAFKSDAPAVLLMGRDGRLISLVLKAPLKQLPLEKDLAVGWIEGEDRIQAANPLQCEAFWQLAQTNGINGHMKPSNRG